MNKTEDIQRINIILADSFERIKASLSEANDIAVLFENLCAGIEKEFEVPYVWLTLIDTKMTDSVIAAVKYSDILIDRVKIIKPEVFREILPSGIKPVLVNKDLQPYYKLLPSTRKYFVKSLALIPFKIKEEIVGSWNNGDAYRDRYTPEMGTDLLQNLAQALSERLTELIAALNNDKLNL
ncbi:response regulator containing a CheY-like receiver domain and a GGDEF domain protein [Smithella sp. ME-1]|nr:response regulator containing a CheY-like receiver domain and a GGDEF domain protein [Smithella sp. ME-1]